MNGFLSRLSAKLRDARGATPVAKPDAGASTPEEFVAAGLIHQHAGRPLEALALYRKVLAQNAGHFDALHLAGVALQQAGDSERAVHSIEQAIRAQPDNPAPHSNLGVAYLSLNRLEQAEAALRRALALKPDWDRAHNNLGMVMQASGHLDDAERCFMQAARLNPTSAEALTNLGNLCRDRGRLDRADEFYRRALDFNPGIAETWNQLGNVLQQSGQPEAALDCYRKAFELRPENAITLNNIGTIHLDRGDIEKAETCFQRALQADDRLVESMSNLAKVFRQWGNQDEAERYCRKALAIRPDHERSQLTLGAILKTQGRLNEADACFRNVLLQNPDSAGAKYSLSMLVLLRGDYSHGFDLFESRFDAVKGTPWETPAHSEFLRDTRRWRGEDLAGRRLLVWVEQGFGDIVMMLRYLPLLRARGVGELIVHCEPALERMVRCLTGVDRVLPCTRSVPADQFDLHCPIMSLPYAFGTRLDTIPGRSPYMVVPDELVVAWTERLAKSNTIRVGLAWAGSRKLQDDARRSIPLGTFEPVIRLNSVRLFSLQKGEAAGQVSDWPGLIEDRTDDCIDFMDTAALIQNLDLVISVDTAIAHLAGALGKPVWLLNRFGSEWRWGVDSECCAWYPSMRIFRQQENSSWAAVMANVATELEKINRA